MLTITDLNILSDFFPANIYPISSLSSKKEKMSRIQLAGVLGTVSGTARILISAHTTDWQSLVENVHILVEKPLALPGAYKQYMAQITL